MARGSLRLQVAVSPGPAACLSVGLPCFLFPCASHCEVLARRRFRLERQGSLTGFPLASPWVPPAGCLCGFCPSCGCCSPGWLVPVGVAVGRLLERGGGLPCGTPRHSLVAGVASHRGLGCPLRWSRAALVAVTHPPVKQKKKLDGTDSEGGHYFLQILGAELGMTPSSGCPFHGLEAQASMWLMLFA